MAVIEYKRGDILAERVEALVNPVNCVGAMGKGLALKFKRTFPRNFSAYKAACQRGEVRIGHVLTFRVGWVSYPNFIINFPTKDHWRDDSQLAFVASGLVSLVEEIKAIEVTSIAIPPLGCGLGGLDWGYVRPLMENTLRDVARLRVVFFEPI